MNDETLNDARIVQGAFIIRKASITDIDILVSLHLQCFDKKTHLIVGLGRSYIRAMYKWFIISCETFILVAEHQSYIVGLIAGSDGSYNRPMLRGTILFVVFGILKHPLLLFNKEFLKRAIKILLGQKIVGEICRNEKGIAYLAFAAIRPSYRGKGLGDVLYRNAIIECIKRGCKRIRGGVRPKDNPGPTKILSGYGFTKEKELETNSTTFWAGEPDIIMSILGNKK
jgi:ribosomal protein S18 acetylase RimI-like enzyme